MSTPVLKGIFTAKQWKSGGDVQWRGQLIVKSIKVQKRRNAQTKYIKNQTSLNPPDRGRLGDGEQVQQLWTCERAASSQWGGKILKYKKINKNIKY